MKKYFIIIISLVVLIIIASSIDMTNFYSSQELIIPKKVEVFDTKLQDILKKPHWYSNKIVRTKGYYHFSFENSSISVHKNSHDAIWIDILTSDTITYYSNSSLMKITIENSNITFRNNGDLDGKYIEVVGVFDDKHLGHLEGFKGTIKDLSKFIILTKQ